MKEKSKTILNRIIFKPKTVFLIDSIGAFLSTAFLFVILSFLQNEFGTLDKRFNYLVYTASIISIYSISCYCLVGKQWQIFLRSIAIINLIYCLLTVWFLVKLNNNITILGQMYFIVEIVIIVCLSVFELKTAKKE